MEQKTLGQMIYSGIMAVITALLDTAKVLLKVVAKTPAAPFEFKTGDHYRREHDRLRSSGLLDRYGNFKK